MEATLYAITKLPSFGTCVSEIVNQVEKTTPSEHVRVETGPMQFGNDWPGVFLRGDDALAYSGALRIVAEKLTQLDNKDWVGKSVLKGIIDLLRSCSVGNTGWPPNQGGQEDVTEDKADPESRKGLPPADGGESV